MTEDPWRKAHRFVPARVERHRADGPHARGCRVIDLVLGKK